MKICTRLTIRCKSRRSFVVFTPFGYLILLLLSSQLSFASDPSQMPGWMKKMSFEAGPAYIDYAFSSAQLNPGFAVQHLKIPNIAFKMAFTYRATPLFSARFAYLMPSAWVTYTVEDQTAGAPAKDNDPASIFTRPVWMNYAGLTFNTHLPLGSRMEAFAGVGAALVTRKGFVTASGVQALNDAVYFSPMTEVGMSYVLHPSWSLVAAGGWIPSSPSHIQPATSFATLGIRFSPPATDPVTAAVSGMHHPRQWVQVGFSSNVAGYGVNDFISTKLRIFWGGRLQVQDGIQLQYQRNIYHTPRWFAIDAGFHIARWRTVPYLKGTKAEPTTFYTISTYPVFRLNFLQTRPADVYFFYGVAGPSYISKSIINDIDLGQRFIFTDTMGVGAFAGTNRKLAVELRIGHYSNGNMFPANPGAKIPLTLLVGTTF